MASINRSRNAEFADLADDDPFAELTRIVGQEARILSGAHAHSANDALSLDMENELLGSLSHFGRHEREVAPAVPEYLPEVQDEESPDEFSEPFSDATDIDHAMHAEFEAAFDDEWDGADETVAFADGQAADEDEGPKLFDRVSAELRTNEFAYPVAPSVVEDDQARILSDEEITNFAAEWEELNQASDHEAGVLPAQDTLSETPFSGREQYIVESQFPDLTHEVRPSEHADAAALMFADHADTAEASIEMPDLLLDSDLEMAFADEERPDLESALEISASDDEMTFDYDKAAANRHDYLGHVFEDTLPDAFEQAQVEAETLSEADELTVSGSDLDAPVENIVAHGSDAGLRAAVRLWGRVRQEPSAPHEDDAAQETASLADTYDAEETAEAAGSVALQDDEGPYVETIDIEDRVAAVADDLDIPEPEPAPEPVADSEFDELAAELAGAFGEMTDEALATPDSVSDEPQQHSTALAEDDRYLADQPDAGPASPIFEDHYQFETAVAGSGFDAPLDPEGREDTNAWTGGMDEDGPAIVPPMRRRAPLLSRFGRRGMFGAAALAGLVLIGGASVFALTAGGGGLGQPALVKASDEPFKVKPKDTGGATVSAGNNEVYQRASGTVGAAPEQKALLKSAEAPVDLAKAVPPRIVDTSAVGSAISEVVPVEKSEARLTPTDDAQEAEIPPALTVQARRVETFIVRPDGTLVPREPAKVEAPATPAAETANEVAAVASPAPAAPVKPVAPVSPVADAAPATTASDNDDAPATASPAVPAPEPVKATVAPVPAERPIAPPAPAVVASVPAPAPATPKPALAPAATQAASDWSVQISSQPTAEAAQESYRTMAQRYGGLLEGRGVNIVKADIAGKGTYYRVRIPSPSKDDAINLCTKLKSAGGNCFVSK